MRPWMVEHDRLDAIDGAGQPAPMTMILIRNAQVYAPEPLGQRDLLLGAGKLFWIGSAAPDLPAAFGAPPTHSPMAPGSGSFSFWNHATAWAVNQAPAEQPNIPIFFAGYVLSISR